MSQSQNTIKGTSRKAHTTPSGVYLERGYVYLTPEAWNVLYALSRGSGMSASQYIASIITTEHGTATEKDSKNDTTDTLPRNN